MNIAAMFMPPEAKVKQKGDLRAFHPGKIGESERVQAISGPIYRSWNGFVWKVVVRSCCEGGWGNDRRTPNGQVAARGRRRAGAPFSRRVRQTKDPRILFWRMVFRAENWLTAVMPNSMDSAIGWISRASGPVDARVTAEYDPLWNFMPLCVWGGCTDSKHERRMTDDPRSSGY